MTEPAEIMSKERLDRYIAEAARVASYQEGFGVPGCDLNVNNWTVAYTRQSSEEQAKNDRLGEYLLTCTKLAKQIGAIVPREYVIYDADSSEDFNRPGMIRLRTQLIAGKAPAHRAAYGYIYRTEKVFEAKTGRAKVLRAWWEINESGPDGQPLHGRPAWVVIKIFLWLGNEGRTAYWVAAKLNELEIRPPCLTTWSPKTVIKIASRRCYTGKGEYNANGRVPNSERPLGDLTLGIKMTLVRPKPENEKVTFDVPPLITEEMWAKSNRSLRERGRGRGKQGKRIQALFRNRMLCPKCGKPMSVLRKNGGEEIYYYCRAHYCPWITNSCNYNRFVPGTWDEEVWDEISMMLHNEMWLDKQLAAISSKSTDLEKLIRLEEFKVSRAKHAISKVQDGWEKGFYTPEESQNKLAEHRDAIARGESEIRRLLDQIANRGVSAVEAELLRQELNALRNRNLEEATFQDKADLVAKLGIKVIPSEDLRSRKIVCEINLGKIVKAGREQRPGFAKVTFGGAGVSIGRTSKDFELSFHLIEQTQISIEAYYSLTNRMRFDGARQYIAQPIYWRWNCK